MMGSCIVKSSLFPYILCTDTLLEVLAASRQSFAFARDGALPLSSILYRMNDFTGTPVNTVWFVAAISILLGLLSLAGTQAINAVFALSVTGLYVAYSIPIAARFIFKNNFKPGPFNLGIFVSSSRDVHTRDPR
jgi:amino acid transporter